MQTKKSQQPLLAARWKSRGLAKSGEQVAITMGVPIGAGEPTNLLKIHTVA